MYSNTKYTTYSIYIIYHYIIYMCATYNPLHCYFRDICHIRYPII